MTVAYNTHMMPQINQNGAGKSRAFNNRLYQVKEEEEFGLNFKIGFGRVVVESIKIRTSAHKNDMMHVNVPIQTAKGILI